MTTNPLPTHNARAVPPPMSNVHSIEFLGDEIFMMGWDGMGWKGSTADQFIHRLRF